MRNVRDALRNTAAGMSSREIARACRSGRQPSIDCLQHGERNLGAAPLPTARPSPTMRQTHVAGETLFVDYAGTKLKSIDWTTGEGGVPPCGAPKPTTVTHSRSIAANIVSM
jgi:hypothetical protein